MAAVPPLPKSFEDAARRHQAVAEELERVCGSEHFRASKRYCEFLRYIVTVTLDGRLDSLKERSIGIDLFGRDTSYEPSSDATVRVRANEVRKRLLSYYTSLDTAGLRALRIDLPTGTYVPRFLPIVADSPARSGGLAVQPTQFGVAKSVQPATSPVFLLDRSAAPAPAPPNAFPSAVPPAVPPIRALTLMRPALCSPYWSARCCSGNSWKTAKNTCASGTGCWLAAARWCFPSRHRTASALLPASIRWSGSLAIMAWTLPCRAIRWPTPDRRPLLRSRSVTLPRPGRPLMAACAGPLRGRPTQLAQA